jgi:galactose mutarotase-like enzyme
MRKMIMENDFFSVEVSSSGAELKKLFAKKWERELLWVPVDANAKNIWKRTSPILFPIVGKLKNDMYTLKGKTYQMPQHGFARDREFTLLKSTPSEMEWFLEADQETFKHYPFCFELRVSYKLEGNKLITLYSVKNVDRQDIFFSIGAHPGFSTPEIDDCEIRFERKDEKDEKEYFQLKDGLVDWKKSFALESNEIKPAKELFLNDALIFKNLKSKYIDLVFKKQNEVLRLEGTNTPFLGIWAKDSVPFLCIEPWYGVSDSYDHDQNFEAKNGIQMLPMGESFEFQFSIELRSIKED